MSAFAFNTIVPVCLIQLLQAQHSFVWLDMKNELISDENGRGVE